LQGIEHQPILHMEMSNTVAGSAGVFCMQGFCRALSINPVST